MSSYPPTPAFGGFQLPQQKPAAGGPPRTTTNGHGALPSSAKTGASAGEAARQFKLGPAPAGRVDLHKSETASTTDSLEEGEVSEEELPPPPPPPAQDGAVFSTARFGGGRPPWPDSRQRDSEGPNSESGARVLCGQLSNKATGFGANEDPGLASLERSGADSWYHSHHSPHHQHHLPPPPAAHRPSLPTSDDSRADANGYNRPGRYRGGARQSVSSHPWQLARGRGSSSSINDAGAADKRFELPSNHLKGPAYDTSRGLALPQDRRTSSSASGIPALRGSGSISSVSPRTIVPPIPVASGGSSPTVLQAPSSTSMNVQSLFEVTQTAIRDLLAARLTFHDIVVETGMSPHKLAKLFTATNFAVPGDAFSGPPKTDAASPAPSSGITKSKVQERSSIPSDPEKEAQEIRKQLEKEMRDRERREAEAKAAELVRQREALKEEEEKKKRAAQVLAAKEVFSKKLEVLKLKGASPGAPTPLSSTPIAVAAAAVPPPPIAPATPPAPAPPRIPGLFLGQPSDLSSDTSSSSQATNSSDVAMMDAPSTTQAPIPPVGEVPTFTSAPVIAASNITAPTERLLPQRRKRPVAADMYSEPTPKRKFGAQRSDDALIIQISDDEDDEVEPAGHISRPGTGSPGRSRNNGAATNGTNGLQRANTVPNGGVAKRNDNSKQGNDVLRKKEMEIQRLREAIKAAQEKKKQSKSGSTAASTPASTPGIGKGPTIAPPAPAQLRKGQQDKTVTDNRPEDVVENTTKTRKAEELANSYNVEQPIADSRASPKEDGERKEEVVKADEERLQVLLDEVEQISEGEREIVDKRSEPQDLPQKDRQKEEEKTAVKKAVQEKGMKERISKEADRAREKNSAVQELLAEIEQRQNDLAEKLQALERLKNEHGHHDESESGKTSIDHKSEDEGPTFVNAEHAVPPKTIPISSPTISSTADTIGSQQPKTPPPPPKSNEKDAVATSGDGLRNRQDSDIIEVRAQEPIKGSTEDMTTAVCGGPGLSVETLEQTPVSRDKMGVEMEPDPISPDDDGAMDMDTSDEETGGSSSEEECSGEEGSDSSSPVESDDEEMVDHDAPASGLQLSKQQVSSVIHTTSPSNQTDDRDARELKASNETNLPPAVHPLENAGKEMKKVAEPVKPQPAPDVFEPYDSPLAAFRSFRYHPRFREFSRDGLKSWKWSNKIDVKKPMCKFEVNGGICNDSACQSQHFREIGLAEEEILVELATTDGYTNEERELYSSELRKEITQMRDQGIKDFEMVATRIAAFRRRFFKDETRVVRLPTVPESSNSSS